MTTSTPAPEILAAALTARLIHDISGPASGIITGLDLQADSGDPALKASGLALATDGARALMDMLDVCRVAFGGSGGSQSAQTLERLTAACFAGRRAKLTWSPQNATFDAAASRSILLLCQIAAAGLGGGGVAELSANRPAAHWRIQIDGRGSRAALPAEAIEGLAGREPGGGVAGRWAPARYLRAVTDSVSGKVLWESLADGFRLAVIVPVEVA